MVDSIQTVLESCLVCKRHTEPNPRYRHDVHAPNKPFHVVSIYSIGPPPIAAGGHRFILIAVDHLTKRFEAATSSSASAKTTASFFLQKVFSRLRSPQVIFSNNSIDSPPRFLQIIQSISKIFIVWSFLQSATNCAVKWAYGTLVSILLNIASSDPLFWDIYLDAALIA